MISNDEELSLILLSPPYYRAKFTKIVMNPFSIILLGYLGKINEDLYKFYLKVFKKNIMEPSVYNNLPYIQVLYNGEIWNMIKKDPNPLESLIKMIEEEKSKNDIIYYFLAEFFKLNLKIYDSAEQIKRPSGYFSSLYNIKSERNYHLFIHKDKNFYPILNQEIDGCIKVLSNKV